MEIDVIERTKLEAIVNELCEMGYIKSKNDYGDGLLIDLNKVSNLLKARQDILQAVMKQDSTIEPLKIDPRVYLSKETRLKVVFIGNGRDIEQLGILYSDSEEFIEGIIATMHPMEIMVNLFSDDSECDCEKCKKERNEINNSEDEIKKQIKIAEESEDFETAARLRNILQGKKAA